MISFCREYWRRVARETRKLPIFQDVYSLVMFNILSPEAEAGYYFNVGFDSFGIFAIRS